MKSFLVGSTNQAPSLSATRYNSVVSHGSITWATAEVGKVIVVPHAMTLDRLRVVVNTAPGSGKSWEFALMVNGSPSVLVATIADTNTSGQDLSNTVSLSAGDRISLRAVPTGTPTSPNTQWWSIRQDAVSLFGVLGLNAGPPNNATRYMSPQSQTSISTTDALGQIIIPSAGSLKNLRIRSNDQAPGSGKSWAVTVVKNGSDQSLTATIADTAQDASDTSNTVTVAAGDTISLKVVPSSTPAASAMSFSLSFDPTNDGESFIALSGNGIGPGVSATEYSIVHGGDFSWNATEGNRLDRLPACTITGMYAQTSATPGVSPKAYALTARIDAADTAATVTIDDASTTVGSTRVANITGLSVAVSDDHRATIKSVPTGTPNSILVKTSLLMYVAPTGGSSQIKNMLGIAQAGLKNVSSIAIGSVKKVSGVTNT